jgi:hypothetical protein
MVRTGSFLAPPIAAVTAAALVTGVTPLVSVEDLGREATALRHGEVWRRRAWVATGRCREFVIEGDGGTLTRRIATALEPRFSIVQETRRRERQVSWTPSTGACTMPGSC